MENQFAVKRIIKDIKNDDLKIQVTGYIRELQGDDKILLDDKTGVISVIIDKTNFNFNKNDLVNVIGELNISMEGEKILNADIIQDMTNLNFEYYHKLYDLKKELE